MPQWHPDADKRILPVAMSASTSSPKTSPAQDTVVITVNYRNEADTIECLESLWRIRRLFKAVYVVDNGSTTASERTLRTWIARKRASDKFILLVSPKNLGFAGGNNLAVRLALQNKTVRFFWFLNNDTIVEATSLTGLRDFLLAHPSTGLVGSKVRFTWAPDTLQGVGARFNAWFATTRCIGSMEKDRGQYDHLEHIDMPMGASMMATREFLERVGLMEESYFLYFEEMDWSVRGRRLGFRPHYAPASVVYHKEGRAIGSNNEPHRRSPMADYYELRNRIRFTARHAFWCLPTVLWGFIVVLANRIRRKQWTHIPGVFRALVGLPWPETGEHR